MTSTDNRARFRLLYGGLAIALYVLCNHFVSLLRIMVPCTYAPNPKPQLL